jgi:hypothetical protein
VTTCGSGVGTCPATLGRALAQIAVSAADWVFSGAALYMLLPHAVPFHVFFAVFLLGQIAALVAQIPGGLGVFEAVILWGLRPALSTPAILVGLVGYRLVYFLLPLLVATRSGWFGRLAAGTGDGDAHRFTGRPLPDIVNCDCEIAYACATRSKMGLDLHLTACQ